MGSPEIWCIHTVHVPHQRIDRGSIFALLQVMISSLTRLFLQNLFCPRKNCSFNFRNVSVENSRSAARRERKAAFVPAGFIPKLLQQFQSQVDVNTFGVGCHKAYHAESKDVTNDECSCATSEIIDSRIVRTPLLLCESNFCKRKELALLTFVSFSWEYVYIWLVTELYNTTRPRDEYCSSGSRKMCFIVVWNTSRWLGSHIPAAFVPASAVPFWWSVVRKRILPWISKEKVVLHRVSFVHSRILR